MDVNKFTSYIQVHHRRKKNMAEASSVQGWTDEKASMTDRGPKKDSEPQKMAVVVLEKGRSDTSQSSFKKGMKKETQSKSARNIIAMIAITLEGIQDKAGSKSIDELVSLFHDEKFDIELFREMVKNREDCRKLTEDIISQTIE